MWCSKCGEYVVKPTFGEIQAGLCSTCLAKVTT